MINISIKKKEDKIVSFEANGHSGYAESGADIVCAAVSTLLESVVNGLTEVVKAKINYSIDEKKPLLYVELLETNKAKFEKAQVLMQTTYLAIKELASSYKKFIKIKEN